MAKTEYCVMNGAGAEIVGGGGRCGADPNNNINGVLRVQARKSAAARKAVAVENGSTKAISCLSSPHRTPSSRSVEPGKQYTPSPSSSPAPYHAPYEDFAVFIANWAMLPPPPLLLHLAIVALLLGSLMAELVTWSGAIGLFIAYLLLTSEYNRRILRTLPRDAKGVLVLVGIKLRMHRAFRRGVPLHVHFLDRVRRHPHKQCVLEVDGATPGRALTFAQFNAHTNAYAHLFTSLDLGNQDVLALYMENGIELFAAWLGASKLGLITAWINTNLKGDPLGHSIRVAKCKAVLTTPKLLPVLQRAISHGQLDSHVPIFVMLGDGERVGELDPSEAYNEPNGPQSPPPSFVREHSLSDSDREPQSPPELNFQSVLCYIYTSGTTGVPKAAIIKHSRYYLMGTAMGEAFGIRATDRTYVTLPMYHSSGGILGTAQVLIKGCTVCIRTKFSASNFWRDCARFDCTVSQYIGELCRYLLAQPRSPSDRAHPVRLLYGNGLRREIWDEFVQRFGVAKIGEIYGSTEGNCSLLNLDNRAGSIGFLNIYSFMAWVLPMRLLKVDPESGELVRNEHGFCIACRPGDTGEMVGIIKETDPIMRFEGYVSGGDTQQKIMRDCCFPGDTVFRSGDILHWDLLGYMYFKDRRGDTYRWRGENVSTTEVEAVLQPLKNILDATVYGVEVPGREGRAGMIGLTLAEGTDIEDFLAQLSARLLDHLAPYAIPVFLRLCDQVDRTGTFKLKKTELQLDGYDLARCASNPVFYWDAARKRYFPLDAEMQKSIDSGEYSQI